MPDDPMVAWGGESPTATKRTSAGGPDTVPPDPGPPWLTIAEIGERPSYRKGLPATSTGLSKLDAVLRGGFRKQNMYTIAGRTGAAKSTLAATFARLLALLGETVLCHKLEESPMELVMRIHAATSQVDMNVMLDGPPYPTDVANSLADGYELIKTLPIRVSGERQLDRIQHISRMHVEDGGGPIILDQINLVSVIDARTPYERVTTASNALRLLACELDVPVIVVTQVNRAASKNKEPLSCNDLRDSGALENDSAAVMLIDRLPDSAVGYRNAEVIPLCIRVAKNRYGAVTKQDDPILLAWWPRIARIESRGPNGGGQDIG